MSLVIGHVDGDMGISLFFLHLKDSNKEYISSNIDFTLRILHLIL